MNEINAIPLFFKRFITPTAYEYTKLSRLPAKPKKSKQWPEASEVFSFKRERVADYLP